MSEIIKEQPFFVGLDENTITLMSGCARNQVFKKNEVIAKENQFADSFYLVKKGLIAVCLSAPNDGDKVIQTITSNHVCGWSWLFPPYKWTFNIIAQDTTHVIAFDGKCLRDKCEADKNLGYDLLMRFSKLLISRLNATRLQLLDVYHAS